MLQLIPEVNRVRAGQTVTAARVVYNGEEVEFTMSHYSRSRIREPQKLFDPINMYWAKLTDAQQREIFDLYEKAHDIMDTSFGTDKIEMGLKPIVNRLCELHPMDKMRQHSLLNVPMMFPPNIRTTIGPDEPHTNEDKTYLRDDYEGLMILSHVLKLLAPIWSMYIKCCRQSVGNGFKEIRALSLISETQLRVDPVIQRLERYLEAQHGRVRSMVAVLEGLPTDQIPEYLLALAVTKSLAAAETNVKDNNLISNIYRTTADSADKMTKEFNSNQAHEKRDLDDSMGVDNDRRSTMEQFRLKVPITGASVVEAEHCAVNEAFNSAREIEPAITRKLINICYRNLQRSNVDIGLSPWYIDMAANIMNEPITFRTSDVMSEKPILWLVACAQAILYKWEFTFLADLMSAKCEQVSANVMRGEVVQGGKNMQLISKDTIEELHKLYPYYRKPKGDKPRGKSDNFAVQWVEDRVKQLLRYNWYQNIPQELRDEGDDSIEAEILFPVDLREKLAQLVIKLNG